MIASTHKKLALGALAALAAAGAWSLREAPTAPVTTTDAPTAPTAEAVVPVAAPAPVTRVPGCSFQVGGRLGYRIAVTARTRFDPKAAVPGASDLVRTVQSTLDLETLSTDARGAVLLARHRDVEPALTAELGDLTSPFLVRVGKDCALAGFARLATTGVREGRGEQALLYNLVWAWPQQGGPSIREGENDYGRFRAAYREIAGPRPRVERRIEAFSRVWSDDWDHIPLDLDDGARPAAAPKRKEQAPRASLTTIDVGAGPWFETFDGTEVIEASGAAVEGHLVATTTPPSPGAFAGVPRDPSRYVWEDLLPRRIRPRSAGIQHTPAEKKEMRELAKLPLPEAMGGYLEHSKTHTNVSESWPRLERYLEARPEAATELGREIKEGRLPEEASAGVFIALGKTPTPEARDALLALKNDPSVPAFDRARSAFALVDRDDVGIELARSLRSESQAITTGPSRPIRLYARHAALALGMFAALKGDTDPGIVGEAKGAALEILARGSTATAMRPGFGTIANIGDPSLLTAIEPYARSPQEAIRKAATISVRRMPPARTTAFCVGWLAAEPSKEVKRDLYHVIHLQHHDAHAIADRSLVLQAISDLAARPSPLTRQSIVRILGAAKDEHPEARAALVAALPLEAEVKDEGIFELVTKYLTGDEVAAALAGRTK